MRLKSDLTLVFVAAIWGSGFIAQRLATTQLSTNYFNGGRFLLGSMVLLVIALVRDGKPKVTRAELPWMILAGGLLFAAAWLQQTGLITTTVSNASFITGMYVVLVPLMLLIVWKKRVSWFSWLTVFMAAAGVMLLSLQGEFRLARGDALELMGAVLWALHVIVIGRLAGQGADVLWFSITQFGVCGLLNLLPALAVDPQGAGNLFTSWPVVVYAGLVPTAIGYTLQVAGQKHAPPVDAAIILSLEAVFGTLFGYLFLQELLSPRQLIGCALMLAAMILAQLRPSEEPVQQASAPQT
jgi:drug/metabolite transporter (DMT)-like permease